MMEKALHRLASSNQLDLALVIAIVEELAEEVAERVAERITVAVPEHVVEKVAERIAERVVERVVERITVTTPVVTAVQVMPSTEVLDYTDVRLPATYDIRCPATLREAVIVSDKPGVIIDLVVDGAIVLHGDFRSLSRISQYSDWVDAFENNGVYVIRLVDISCRERLTLDVNALHDVRAERILLKIDRLWKG